MDNQLNYCIYRNKNKKNKCDNCIIDKIFCFKHQKYFKNNLLYIINNIFNNDDISIINYKIMMTLVRPPKCKNKQKKLTKKTLQI